MTHRAKRVKVFCFFFSRKKALLFEKVPIASSDGERIASCDRESKNFYPFLPC
jgi:hypothetical protein